MALAGSGIMEVRPGATASNVNGGGFNPANANFLTDGVITAGTGESATLESATYDFVAGDVGASVFCPAQTAFTFASWAKIVSVAGGIATLDTAAGKVSYAVGNWNNIWASTSAGFSLTASPTGVTFGVDYSQQDTAKLSLTDLASVGASTTVTSAAGLFTPVMVGNYLKLNTTGTGAHGLTQFFELVSYTNTTTMVTDRTTNDGTAMAAVSGKVGGALALPDATVWALTVASAAASTHWFYQQGTFSLPAFAATATAGHASCPSIHEGYKTTRGDKPVPGDSQPLFNVTTGGFGMGATNVICISLSITGTSSAVFTQSANHSYNCKSVNTSGTAGRAAVAASGGFIHNGELVSVKGNGIAPGGGITTTVDDGTWIHDCNLGATTATGTIVIRRARITDCYTAAVSITGANTNNCLIAESILDGNPDKLGTGILLATGTTRTIVRNNNISGFATGISHADTQSSCHGDGNNFFNNTANVNAAASWQFGKGDTFVDPGFAAVSSVKGTTATTSNTGNTLVDTTKDFTTLGVVAGKHYLTIISGGTAGKYSIASISTTTNPNDTLNLEQAPGVSAGNVVYRLTLGQDYTPGSNLSGKAVPQKLAGNISSSYSDIGGVQRQPSAGIVGAFTLGG